MQTYQHRVRYHETDAQGFLFNARFLELTDVAMAEFFRKLGWSYDALVGNGVDPSVVSVVMDFRAPARFDEVLDVDVSCLSVGRSSFTLRFAIERSGDVIASVDIVYVNVDSSAAASRPLTDDVAAALRAAVAG